MYKEKYLEMECEQSYISFCTLFPIIVGSIVFLKLDTLVDVALNGSGIGKLKKVKHNVTVDTSEGTLKIPTAKFPNMDWEMFFIDEDTDVKDGVNDLDAIENLKTTKCKQYRDLVLCEYVYSTDLRKGDIKLVVSSPLDDLCYLSTIKEGEIIDYKKNIQEFLKEIEEN